MDREEWIRHKAYALWNENGRPNGMDLSFWLAAEREYDDHSLCILSPDNCKHQEVVPTNGGRHASICRNHYGCCQNKIQVA
jgi:hypothetical protein